MHLLWFYKGHDTKLYGGYTFDLSLSSFLEAYFPWTLLTWTSLPWPFLPPLCGCFTVGVFFPVDIIPWTFIFSIRGHFFRGGFFPWPFLPNTVRPSDQSQVWVAYMIANTSIMYWFWGKKMTIFLSIDYHKWWIIISPVNYVCACKRPITLAGTFQLKDLHRYALIVCDIRMRCSSSLFDMKAGSELMLLLPSDGYRVVWTTWPKLLYAATSGSEVQAATFWCTQRTHLCVSMWFAWELRDPGCECRVGTPWPDVTHDVAPSHDARSH